MTIPIEVKLARLRFLRDTFGKLQVRYQKENQNVIWSGGQTNAETVLDSLWESYTRDVEDVRCWLMEGGNEKIDRHKIIALTQLNILDVCPLVFDNDAAGEDVYRLNVQYAYLFGLQYITCWNIEYYPDPFFPELFIYPLLHTNSGRDFQVEHYKLLMRHREHPISLFWASQLWFLLEQWGLTYMESKAKFLHSSES